MVDESIVIWGYNGQLERCAIDARDIIRKRNQYSRGQIADTRVHRWHRFGDCRRQCIDYKTTHERHRRDISKSIRNSQNREVHRITICEPIHREKIEKCIAQNHDLGVGRCVSYSVHHKLKRRVIDTILIGETDYYCCITTGDYHSTMRWEYGKYRWRVGLGDYLETIVKCIRTSSRIFNNHISETERCRGRDGNVHIYKRRRKISYRCNRNTRAKIRCRSIHKATAKNRYG